jgi:hypothetical protein
MTIIIIFFEEMSAYGNDQRFRFNDDTSAYLCAPLRLNIKAVNNGTLSDEQVSGLVHQALVTGPSHRLCQCFVTKSVTALLFELALV